MPRGKPPAGRPRTNKISLDDIRRKATLDQRATMPDSVRVPEAPVYANSGAEKGLYEEQQVARVELLMTKGVRARSQLMALLAITDPRAIDRFIDRVHARWEMTGTTQDHARHRGEGLNRLDLIESELWVRLQNSTDQRLNVTVLANLLNVQHMRNEMVGLTAKTIERIGAADGDSIAFNRSAAAHERLSLVAARVMKLIEERTETKVIEHDPPSEES